MPEKIGNRTFAGEHSDTLHIVASTPPYRIRPNTRTTARRNIAA